MSNRASDIGWTAAKGAAVADATEPKPTRALIDQASAGNERALRAICDRFGPKLTAWGRGRLPSQARDLLATEDIAQDVIARSLERLGGFRSKDSGSFLAYLKTAFMNRVRNEIRNAGRRPSREELPDNIPALDPSPIEQILGREAEKRYNEALKLLSPEEQELVIGRLELQMTYHELAIHTAKASPDAARMAVYRAIRKLATVLKEEDAG
jgi:RNA polymerase sigma factor (sigma-70 family)